jgi:DNA processing protein
MPETGLLLRLNRLTYLSPRDRIILAQRLETEESLRRARLDELSLMVGRPLSPGRYGEGSLEFDLQGDHRALQDGEISLCSFFDADYPPRLRQIFDPPLLLFVRGHRELLNDHAAVSIVGTRAPTPGGLDAAKALAEAVARDGYPVVSGLARGIDGAAHRGALRHPGGRTIAVLGSGIDNLYPPQHRPLATEILASGGAIVSEYPPGAVVRKHQFPERNRIIAGMSALLWVVQAPKDSGALITADFALDGNRDVVVHAAGAGREPESEGSRRLVSDGAGVYEEWAGYLRESAWPPEKVAELTVEETLLDWATGAGDSSPPATGGGKQVGRRQMRRRTEEMLSGQELLALFSGEEEET